MSQPIRDQLVDGHLAKPLIRELPVEVLEWIFWIVCSNHDADKKTSDINFLLWDQSWRDVSRPVSRQYYRSLAKLSSVCKSWYNVSRNTPRLWRVISSSDPSDITDAACLRSGQSPLIVKGKFGWNRPNREEDTFLPKVWNHVGRWEEADFEFSDKPENRFFQSPAPRLRHFRLDVRSFRSFWHPWNPPQPYQPIHLFRGDAPALETLHISGVCIMWPAVKFNSLQTLSLTAVTITSTELLSVLSNISALGELELHELELTNAETTRLTAKVALPRLTRCTFAGLSTASAMTVLDNILAPVCKRLHFNQQAGGGLGPWEDTPIAAWLVANLYKPFPLLLESPATWLSVSNFAGGMRFIGGHYNRREPINMIGSKPRLHFQFAESPTPMAFLVWLAEGLGHPPITLDIPSDVCLEMNDGILHKIPSTSRLSLHGKGHDLTPLLESLGTPFRNEGKLRWLLPNLHNLFFNNDLGCTRDDVLRMLQRRYHNPDGVSPPARLNCLVIKDVPPGIEDARTIGSLEQLLGKHVVVWKDPASAADSELD